MNPNPVTPTPLPTRERVQVPDSVLDRLAKISSGSLTTQLYKKGLRQPVLVGLRPLQGAKVPHFAGRAYTMRMIPVLSIFVSAAPALQAMTVPSPVVARDIILQ